MKFLLVLALASAPALAAASDPLGELAQRSGLPASEVRAIVADCDASQLSLNFCAWRDQIVAERKLEYVVDKKSAASPTCKKTLSRELLLWKRRRDASCRKSAQREWGNGSMSPAATAICATEETKRMTQAIIVRKGCT